MHYESRTFYYGVDQNGGTWSFSKLSRRDEKLYGTLDTITITITIVFRLFKANLLAYILKLITYKRSLASGTHRRIKYVIFDFFDIISHDRS